ncbi:hypothetical protein QJQ45_024289 [Haematococcus lacustris]|nr:hypothetical protein QJQ45_024289 [Haematococcus lacustris]
MGLCKSKTKEPSQQLVQGSRPAAPTASVDKPADAQPVAPNPEQATEESQSRTTINSPSTTMESSDGAASPLPGAAGPCRGSLMQTISSSHSAIPSFSTARSDSSRLLIHNTSAPDQRKQAMSAFHTEQHEGLYRLRSELEMLSDLHLDMMLGKKASSMVMREPDPACCCDPVMVGLWRGSTEVAVKLFTTANTDLEQGASGRGHPGVGSSQLPLRVLAEALLAKDLAHPNIINTFDVRCCQLSQVFITALFSQQATAGPNGNGVQPLSTSEAAIQAGSSTGSIGNAQTSHMAQMSSMLETFSSYDGITPLWPKAPQSASSGSEAGFGSLDGFGPVNLASNAAGLSWVELIQTLGAKPGDFLTIIVMQYAGSGSLWRAIQMKVFSREPTAAFAERRRSLRALLRTAREIAMGLEHLHVCGVVHGDVRPGNVLLHASRIDARGFSAILTDFGLAQLINATAHNVEAGTLSGHVSAYSGLAPELLGNGQASRATDIYSFGICLYEMAHGHAAEPGPQQEFDLSKREAPSWLVAADASTAELQKLYEWCVARDAARRPTASTLVVELARLEDSARAESRRETAALKGRRAATTRS